MLDDLPRPEFRAQLKERLVSQWRSESDRPAAARSSASCRGRHRVLRPRLRRCEQMRFEAGGSIPHTRLVIGDSLIVVADERELRFPRTRVAGGSTVGIRLDVTT
jgi:hypothetical protein